MAGRIAAAIKQGKFVVAHVTKQAYQQTTLGYNQHTLKMQRDFNASLVFQGFVHGLLNPFQPLSDVPPFLKPDNLVDDHSYTVISMKKLAGTWVITLRNPWGSDPKAYQRESLSSRQNTNLVNPYTHLVFERLIDGGGVYKFQVSGHRPRR
jgi:hypothetical protein